MFRGTQQGVNGHRDIQTNLHANICWSRVWFVSSMPHCDNVACSSVDKWRRRRPYFGACFRHAAPPSSCYTSTPHILRFLLLSLFDALLHLSHFFHCNQCPYRWQSSWLACWVMQLSRIVPEKHLWALVTSIHGELSCHFENPKCVIFVACIYSDNPCHQLPLVHLNFMSPFIASKCHRVSHKL